MITHVAVRYLGKVYTLPKPYRHHDVLRTICDELKIDSIGENLQGFVDDKFGFVTRKHAFILARDANQISDKDRLEGYRGGFQLFSEDVW